MGLGTKLMGLITRAIVDRSDDSKTVPEIQVRKYGRASVVEQFQPQGLYFVAPEGSEGVLVSTGGSLSSAVLLSAQDRETWPAGEGNAQGTGGLHYLGDWKVFLGSDGVLHLGTKEGESLISRDDKVQTELARIKAELDAVKADLTTLSGAFSSGAPVPNDGGAALQTAWIAAVATVPTVSPAEPGETAAQNVKTT